jgi:hypothetical protein
MNNIIDLVPYKDTKALDELRTSISAIETEANNIQIHDADQYAAAADILARVKVLGSAIKSKKETITKPLNEALKNIRDLFRPIEEQFIKAEDALKTKVLGYKRKVDAEAKAKEEKLADRVDRGTMKYETAERKMGEIERVETTTRGSYGQVQVKKIKKVRIVDETKIPRFYLIPDMVRIRKEVLAGITIDGVETYEEEIITAGLK